MVLVLGLQGFGIDLHEFSLILSLFYIWVQVWLVFFKSECSIGFGCCLHFYAFKMVSFISSKILVIHVT